MPASEAQIRANRLNSSRSTGPKTEAGKARSRINATKHGLAGALPELEGKAVGEFQDRRGKWAAEQAPVGEAGNWALDRAVAATFRIERCERAIDRLVEAGQARAALAWDEDRAIEAATIAAGLARDPVLASRRLQATRAGVELLIEAWLGLLSPLEQGNPWSEDEVSKALDLLGVAVNLRSGRTPIDPLDGSDPIAFRRELARDEVDRLEALRDDAMIPLDEMDRRQAIQGDIHLLSNPARLILRYERDAWRRHREAMRQLREAQVEPPAVARPSAVIVKPQPPPDRSFEAERRALQAEAAPIRKEVTDRLRAEGLDDEDAWLDALEARLDKLMAMPTPAAQAPAMAQFSVGQATERSQFRGGVDRASSKKP